MLLKENRAWRVGAQGVIRFGRSGTPTHACIVVIRPDSLRKAVQSVVALQLLRSIPITHHTLATHYIHVDIAAGYNLIQSLAHSTTRHLLSHFKSRITDFQSHHRRQGDVQKQTSNWPAPPAPPPPPPQTCCYRTHWLVQRARSRQRRRTCRPHIPRWIAPCRFDSPLQPPSRYLRCPKSRRRRRRRRRVPYFIAPRPSQQRRPASPTTMVQIHHSLPEPLKKAAKSFSHSLNFYRIHLLCL